MLCRNPFIKKGTAYGCGQCLPCRINRRRIWSHRICLESLCHTENCFLTLTYTDQMLPRLTGSPTGEGLGTLEPKDLQDWLKRLREAISPLKLRFYAVGEYGDVTFRPHYHVCLFGFASCVRGRTLRHFATGERLWEECCPRCRLVGNTWKKGLVDLGELNPSTASYCAEYTVKKMTSFVDGRLKGRHPEFARMSLKPGIGSDAMWQVASDMIRFRLDGREDVPYALAHGKRELPLGRHLMGKLRERIGRDAKAPEAVLHKMDEILLPVREAAFNASRSFKEAIVESNAQTIANMEARALIQKQRKSL